MSQAVIEVDPASLDAAARPKVYRNDLFERPTDLQTILAAWHTATLRLERTHNALRDEVRQLTAELEIKNRELARKNRLADLGQMASHVAHEVRNNLVPVTLYLSMLRRRAGGDAESLGMLEKISSGFRAMDVMVNDLLHFTSDRGPQLAWFSLRKLVTDVEASLAPQLAAQKIRFEVNIENGDSPRLARTRGGGPPREPHLCEAPEGPSSTYLDKRRQMGTVPVFNVRADREMLRRAVLNLVLNALDVMPQGGTLRVSAGATVDCLELRVADSGPGLPEEILPRIFDPFFTTKPGGTGLGLAIVARVAEAHGGTVAASNGDLGGAEFTLRLPNSPAPSVCPVQEAA